jgi:hypothetical protein
MEVLGSVEWWVRRWSLLVATMRLLEVERVVEMELMLYKYRLVFRRPAWK